jgi:hypothetical protein
LSLFWYLFFALREIFFLQHFCLIGLAKKRGEKYFSDIKNIRKKQPLTAYFWSIFLVFPFLLPEFFRV